MFHGEMIYYLRKCFLSLSGIDKTSMLSYTRIDNIYVINTDCRGK